jgi:hypothetical protein
MFAVTPAAIDIDVVLAAASVAIAAAAVSSYAWAPAICLNHEADSVAICP